MLPTPPEQIIHKGRDTGLIFILPMACFDSNKPTKVRIHGERSVLESAVVHTARAASDPAWIRWLMDVTSRHRQKWEGLLLNSVRAA